MYKNLIRKIIKRRGVALFLYYCRPICFARRNLFSQINDTLHSRITLTINFLKHSNEHNLQIEVKKDNINTGYIR